MFQDDDRADGSTASTHVHTHTHIINSAAAKESGQGVRTFAAAAAAANSPVQLPDLPYGYGELEPVISGGEMRTVWLVGCVGLDWIVVGLDPIYDVYVPLIHTNTEIMELHHKKHHQAYVTNFNAALEKLAAAEVSRSSVLPSIGGHVWK